MNQLITVIPAEQTHYQEMLEIYNESFLSKFRFVTKKNPRCCVDDFRVLDLGISDRYFVAICDDQILGVLVLIHSDQEKRDFSPNLSVWKLFLKYGLRGMIKAIILDSISSHNPVAGELFIDSIGVASSARGKGIGTLLLAFAENLARKKGFNQISLEVMYENQRAKSLYERSGYRVKSSSSFRWMQKATGYSGAYFMVRDLQVP